MVSLFDCHYKWTTIRQTTIIQLNSQSFTKSTSSLDRRYVMASHLGGFINEKVNGTYFLMTKRIFWRYHKAKEHINIR